MTIVTDELGYGDYLRFRDLVHKQSGLYFPEKKRTDLALGLRKALNSTTEGIDNLADYYNYLNQASTPQAKKELARFINLLTIGETHFFRDSPQFEALSSKVLPAIIQRKREAANLSGGSPQLRLWSAGCASGEEAYSLAILLFELIPDIKNWNILILATDINESSLERARKAIYTDWSFRESRALALRSVYFTRQNKRYRLNVNVRQMVTFAQHNLIEDDFPAIYNNTTAMDLILCRNVTIYFSEATTRQLVQKFHKALLNDGWLVVGHSEPSLMVYNNFQANTFPGTLLYQKTSQSTAISDERNTLTKPTPISANLANAEKIQVTKPEQFSMGKAADPRRTDFLPTLPQTNGANRSMSEDENVYETARQLLSLGELEQTILVLKPALHRLSSEQLPSAYCLLARAYADQEQWYESRRWCQLAIEANPLLGEAYYVLSMVDDQVGDLEGAVANLKKVVYLNGQQPLAHFNLAMIYQKQGKIKLAWRALTNASNILTKWPPDQIIPDSGGTNAYRLLVTVQTILANLEQDLVL